MSPQFIQQRAALRKQSKRGNKWGDTFKKNFTGNAARAWHYKRDQHGEEALKEGLAPKAKISPTETKKKLIPLQKSKAKAKAVAIEDGKAEDGDECKKADGGDNDKKDKAAAR